MTSAHLKAAASAWDHMGTVDPLFAVLTEDGKAGGKWDLPDFWERGKADVRERLESLSAALERAGIREAQPDDAVALDFGCGVGRLSRAVALCGWYETVIGLDFAPSMIAKAKELDDGDLVDFRVNPGPGIELEDASVDLVLSLISLQHIDIELQHGYLREFMRVLKPGGCAIVGMMAAPIRPPRPQDRGDYGTGKEWAMEMAGCDIEAVIRTFRLAGGRVLDFRMDLNQSEWSPVWVCVNYIVQKPAAQ